MVELGFLEEIDDLRTVWKNEAQDFTPWLAKPKNMQILGATLGLDIETEDVESSVGDFSLDILAEEVGTGRKIIIENQLESTNHDHLGKLITYAAGKSSHIVVWIVKIAREEHKAAIEWLNSISSDEFGFFLCEIKLYKIGDSLIAPKFEVVEQPNGWIKQQKKYLAEIEEKTLTQVHRNEFWMELGNYLLQQSDYKKKFRRRAFNCYDSWVSFGLGTSDYELDLLYKEVSEYYGFDISWNGSKKDDYVLSYRKEIEDLFFGEQLEWSLSGDTGNKYSKFSVKKDLNVVCGKMKQFEWLFLMMLKCKEMVETILVD